MIRSNQVLVVAAHPDDEMLGCAGTLAKLKSKGAEVTILLLGEGPTARESHDSERVAESRSEAMISAQQAAFVLGINDVRFGGLPDNKFDTIPLLSIIQLIERVKQETMPDLVLTHHAGDLNLDHQLAHRAALTAFRPLPGEKAVTILSFEVLSSTEYTTANSLPPFLPNLYVDISDFLDKKQKALQAYASEMRPWPHPRSHEAVEHLAKLRGCECGVDAAEAVMLCRGVVK